MEKNPGLVDERLITHFTLYPGAYGDPLAVTFLDNGGLTLAPSINGEADEHRRMVLDSEQVSDFTARLKMSPDEATLIVSRHIINNMPDMGGAVLIFGLTMGILGIIAGLGAGLVFF